MLAAMNMRRQAPVYAGEQYFIEELGKLQQHLQEAEQSLAALDYVRATWAFRSAFALLLDDFRRVDAVLPVAQRCELFARLCRAWQASQVQLPDEHQDVAAMRRFIERQRRRVEFYACAC